MLVGEELHLAFIARNTNYPLSIKCLFDFCFRSKTGAYLSFCCMKRLGVFPPPPGWDAWPSQGNPQT